MIVELIYKNEDGELVKRNIKNIWEVHDNDGKELVVKEHNHTCERFDFENIKEIKLIRG